MLRWFEQTGDDSDVVLSGCIRLARNINDYKFSLKINDNEAQCLLDDVSCKLGDEQLIKSFSYYTLADMDKVQKDSLTERFVINSFLSQQTIAGVFVSADEKMSIMVNGEDHLLIQAIVAGMDIHSAYEAANRVDDIVGSYFEYAYDNQFGYLTSSPLNVGTGLRASYMLHLPALNNSKKIQDITDELEKFGLSIKPAFSNKGNADGHLYRISNQHTLGQKESQILDKLNNAVEGIIQQERKCRDYFVRKERLKIEDEVYKSYGILRYSRKMNISDAMLLLSKLRMGLVAGIIRMTEEQSFMTCQMMIGVQPANLRMLSGIDVSDSELDEFRAAFIRDNLPALN